MSSRTRCCRRCADSSAVTTRNRTGAAEDGETDRRVVRHRRDPGAYRRCRGPDWAWAFDQLYGVCADIGKHTSAGETDPQVGRGTFRAVLGREPSYDEMARLYAKYLWHLSEDIWTSQAYRLLDGAEDLLQRLTNAGIILGVISGAMEGAARTKMEPGKLNRYFVFGSYGSDSPDRTEVTRLGIAKAARLHGRDLSAEDVYVVGDTPRDVAASRAAGATAIGVASGHYSADELRAAKADHVLRSLTEPFPGL